MSKCNCQNEYMYRACNQKIKQDEYAEAKRHFPSIDDPLKNWKCDDEYAKTCKQFKPFPPRMTSQEFTTEQNNLLSKVPVEFHSKLSYMAYEQGHSAGMEEIIGILNDLVNDLLPCIKAFEERIKKNGNETR